MTTMRRWFRAGRVALLAGLLPAFFLQCDKAALNAQRGFWQGLGFQVSEVLAAQVDFESLTGTQ